jgi:hypothetical protein
LKIPDAQRFIYLKTIFVALENRPKQMEINYKRREKYNYIEIGEGTPIVILHGLMGGLSNFEALQIIFQ